MKLYLINNYEAYRADEKGVYAGRKVPEDTIYYKHEILEEANVQLPDGYEIGVTRHGEEAIFKGSEYAFMITERKGNTHVTSLVTSDGIVRLHTWKAK